MNIHNSGFAPVQLTSDLERRARVRRAMLEYAKHDIPVVPTTWARSTQGGALVPKALAFRNKRVRDVATTNRNVIEGWFQGHSELIGPIVGVALARFADAKILMLDIDVKNSAPGLESAKRLGIETPDCGYADYIECTPSSGLHLAWKLPDGFDPSHYAHSVAGLEGLELYPSGNDARSLVVSPSPGYGGFSSGSITESRREGHWTPPPAALLDAFRIPDRSPGFALLPPQTGGATGALCHEPRRVIGWLKGKIEGRCRDIASTGPGGRRNAVNDAGYDIFGCIAGSELDQAQRAELDLFAQAELSKAASLCGWASDDGVALVQQTIEIARRDGFAKPRRVPLPPSEVPAIESLRATGPVDLGSVIVDWDPPEASAGNGGRKGGDQ